MADSGADILKLAREEAWASPLEDIDVSFQERFRDFTFWPFFERLRKEAPVHFCKESEFGPYWSIVKFDDIVTVETNHQVFSSEGGITIQDEREDFQLPMFIAMDPPKHDVQRKTVSPIVSPHSLMELEPLIRERAGKILDELPRDEEFNWVDRVSIELTTQMLATLFDFPWEERRKLTWWSDVAVHGVESGLVATEEEGQAELLKCAEYFTNLWQERIKAPPKHDLISMMAHSPSMRDMGPMEFLGNLILLIVGGNDTTRNSISGGLLAMNENPDQFAKLKADPALIPSMVSETIRWQTPLAHMRRRALEDFEVHGVTIPAGAKVVMWYVSGNRDEDVIPNADAYVIDRERPRHHVSFGFGIHRCVGNRLAEMQLRIVWEELLKRWDRIDVVGPPKRVMSCFIKGYEALPVVIPKSAKPVVMA